LYPDPSDGTFSIHTERSCNSTVEVRDPEGRLIFSGNYFQTSQIDISLNTAPGIYFVTLVSNGQGTTRKIICH
ncbi:MAG TPA: T9SS type A sorting domain-containing protein, partial [Bacteroidia bacterium]|nr:T9SS type A sorting domain-containing protein [Bacteroidia bacterium]